MTFLEAMKLEIESRYHVEHMTLIDTQFCFTIRTIVDDAVLSTHLHLYENRIEDYSGDAEDSLNFDIANPEFNPEKIFEWIGKYINQKWN